MKKFIFCTAIIYLMAVSVSESILGQSLPVPLKHYTELNRNKLPVDLHIKSSLDNYCIAGIQFHKLAEESVLYASVGDEFDSGNIITNNLYNEKKDILSENVHYSMNLYMPDPVTSAKEAGKTVGKFFLGALTGAACTALTLVLLEGEETYPGSSSTMHYSNPAVWIVGGAIAGGVLFVFTL